MPRYGHARDENLSASPWEFEDDQASDERTEDPAQTVEGLGEIQPAFRTLIRSENGYVRIAAVSRKSIRRR